MQNAHLESVHFWFKKGENKKMDRGTGCVGCFSLLNNPVYLCGCVRKCASDCVGAGALVEVTPSESVDRWRL